MNVVLFWFCSVEAFMPFGRTGLVGNGYFKVSDADIVG